MDFVYPEYDPELPAELRPEAPGELPILEGLAASVDAAPGRRIPLRFRGNDLTTETTEARFELRRTV